MDYVGLIFKYPVNRPLAPFEKDTQLKQKIRLDIEPFYQLNVIRVNSTYLESIDKFYSWKGALSGILMIPIVMFGWVIITTFIDLVPIISEPHEGLSPLSALIIMSIMFIPFFYGLFWLLHKESFAWTHYPIRLNRKTRMVYVFRTNGTVLSVPWDELFFTLGGAGGSGLIQNWDLRGHVLDKDGNTVKESFTFSMVSNKKEDLYQLWEFIRRYMEEGPQDLYKQVEFCMPVSEKRESYFFGLKRLIVNFKGQSFLQALMMPFFLLYSIGRVFAMWTSRIPKWPQEVENACRIEPGDPYIKDFRTNPK
jgi:hypothetical protein